jgi:hypothetical protein
MSSSSRLTLTLTLDAVLRAEFPNLVRQSFSEFPSNSAYNHVLLGVDSRLNLQSRTSVIVMNNRLAG